MEKLRFRQRIEIVIVAVLCALTCTFIISKPKNEKLKSPIQATEITATVRPSPTESISPKLERKDNVFTVSWYGQEYCDKYSPRCITASGEKFVDSDFTCACANRYPLGTIFKVSYQGNSVITRCNDRGGFENMGRTLDLSKASFEALAPLSRGVLQVEIEVL